jgi:hypothetical protein
MSIGSTTARLAAIAAPPLVPDKSDCLRPGALARLHDPAPAWVSGLSDDFLAGRYGRSFADIVKESRQ